MIQHQISARKVNSPAPVALPTTSGLTFAGYQTPQATLESSMWAMSRGDTEAFLACLTPEGQAGQSKKWQGKSKEALTAEGKQQFASVTGVKILDQTAIGTDRVMATVLLEGIGRTEKMAFQKIGNEWKLAR